MFKYDTIGDIHFIEILSHPEQFQASVYVSIMATLQVVRHRVWFKKQRVEAVWLQKKVCHCVYIKCKVSCKSNSKQYSFPFLSLNNLNPSDASLKVPQRWKHKLREQASLWWDNTCLPAPFSHRYRPGISLSHTHTQTQSTWHLFWPRCFYTLCPHISSSPSPSPSLADPEAFLFPPMEIFTKAKKRATLPSSMEVREKNPEICCPRVSL